MPLAPAHPAVVLPLRGLGLPLSALVVGAVAPDLPVYLPVGVSYATTHSGWGIPAVVVIGMVLLVLWVALVRDAVVDLTPYLRRRLPATARLGHRAWLVAPLAVAVGAGTHVLWDSATHDWGFLVEELAFLREEYGPVPLYRWLQHVSTIVGTIIVASYGMVRLRRMPVLDRPPAVGRSGLWLVPVPLAALAVGIVLRDPEAGVGAALVVLLVVAAAWRSVRSPLPTSSAT
ncbi:DUF4184 family protein [Nocardioides sediminis]|uniref:DUF4184 family protein n=1 Tax=Nocardioides sediminis TaxID=433648 RepID=UPI000D314ED1|nr:DUF4184 family protein [Nocardioides sediminis]